MSKIIINDLEVDLNPAETMSLTAGEWDIKSENGLIVEITKVQDIPKP